METPLKVSPGAIVRKTLFEVWLAESNINKRTDRVYDYIVFFYNVKDCSEDILSNIKYRVRDFCYQLKRKWQRSHRTKDIFLSKNKKWLEDKLIFSDAVAHAIKSRQPSGSGVGRPRKLFEESSTKTKKRRVETLVATSTSKELSFAMQTSLRSEGRRDAANLVQQASDFSPKRATRIKKAFQTMDVKRPIRLTNEQALALFVDNKLTKKQYMSIRKIAKAQNADIYPPYHALIQAKKLCYPENIEISEISAEVKLQAILDHTISRIINTQYQSLKEMKVGKETSPLFSAVFKWGCDGASSQSTYKQKFHVEESESFDDSCLFAVSLVPLEITTRRNSNTMDDSELITVWQNASPSSTRYCRPIKLLFMKETADLTREEIKKIEVQIEHLTPTKVEIDSSEILVEHNLFMTMVDGKICSSVTGQSSQNCYVCGATPKEMNDLESHSKRKSDPATFNFGLSILHTWIRFFECLLHIAYRTEIKTWRVSKSDKHNMLTRKKQIQERFRKEMGLLVDIPKQGSGTTNDGNTARRFFANPKVAHSITGINIELIKRFSVILQAISCGLQINVEKFENYTAETARFYKENYDWYYMPASVHKILIHGGCIIKSAIVPIGQLSEEAQEARNKDCRRYREGHTRKFSREATMEDLFHMLLITSDPVISSKRRVTHKKSRQVSEEVRALLTDPSTSESAGEESSSSDEEKEGSSSSNESD